MYRPPDVASRWLRERPTARSVDEEGGHWTCVNIVDKVPHYNWCGRHRGPTAACASIDRVVGLHGSCRGCAAICEQIPPRRRRRWLGGWLLPFGDSSSAWSWPIRFSALLALPSDPREHWTSAGRMVVDGLIGRRCIRDGSGKRTDTCGPAAPRRGRGLMPTFLSDSVAGHSHARPGNNGADGCRTARCPVPRRRWSATAFGGYG